MSTTPADLRQTPPRRGAPPPHAARSSAWKNLNLSASRLAIEDDDLAWLENGMWLDRSITSVPLYNGPAGASQSSSLIKQSFGGSLTYGSFTVPHPVAITVYEDGSAWMRDFYLDNLVDIQVAAIGTFGSSPKGTDIVMWQDGPVLIIDDAWGYGSWNGAALTLIDGTKTGHALAVFEGHVWLLTAPRTITYTAPNKFDDFVAGNGAGSFKITDEAFIGAVTGLVSTVEELWIFGASSIDALGNVATAAGVTTFSVTNALTTLGSIYRDSLSGYFRAVTFYTGYSIHSLLGVTPQKLSAKLDRLFAALSPAITFGPKSGVQQLNGFTILCFLFTFTNPNTGAVRSELLCFQEGKWFLCTTPDLNGNRVVDLVTLTINAVPEVYGIDRSGRLYRLFARATDAAQGTMTVASKLFDLGDPLMGHQAVWVGFDLVAPKRTSIAPISLTLTSEAAALALPVANENFQAVKDSPLGLRYALLRRDAPMAGNRIGWTLSVPCSYGLTLDAAYLQVGDTNDWESNDPTPVPWDFTGLNGQAFQFTGAAAAPFDWLGSRTG